MTTDQSLSLTRRYSEVRACRDEVRTVSVVSLPSAATKPPHAFTIIELLVALAVLALMISLLATARAGSRPNIKGELCLNNMRQMMAGFTMYTHDYSDLFPPNPASLYSTPGCMWVSGNVSGGMPYNSPAGGDAWNSDLLKDASRSLLVPYIRTNISLFRCPFDPRIALYAGSDPTMFGLKVPVVRSISMNQGVGTKGTCAGGSAGNAAVDGPWLSGNFGHTANNPYATFGKWSDFRVARPSDIWVLVDDDPWTINDASMAVIASQPDFVDYPSAFNNNGTTFSFADGHAETHKWASTLFIHTGVPARTTPQPGLQYQDWFWWASHATRSTITGTVP
jgi:prepilin-type N-terminal cleavage/methylation domain-containing protein/prepilin-type processing-associated H-X9-DG protein